MDYYWILDGHTPVPADNDTWRNWFFKNDRTVKVTAICCPDGSSTVVSTVFIGLNMALSDPAEVFETLTTGPGRVVREQRYTTWDEAVAGHDALVKSLIRPDCTTEDVVHPARNQTGV